MQFIKDAQGTCLNPVVISPQEDMGMRRELFLACNSVAVPQFELVLIDKVA